MAAGRDSERDKALSPWAATPPALWWLLLVVLLTAFNAALEAAVVAWERRQGRLPPGPDP